MPRLGPAPSFEALAQSVTRDVHPRTLLDELCRLGLARVDAQTDQVHLPGRLRARGDEPACSASSGSTSATTWPRAWPTCWVTRKHFEQSIHADELSDESIVAAKKLVNAQWRAVMAAIVPELEALVEADRKALQRNRAHRANRSLRIGLYSYDEEPNPKRDKTDDDGCGRGPGSPRMAAGRVGRRRRWRRGQHRWDRHGRAADLVVGTITGFGSVIVNGVRYDETAATITPTTGARSRRAELKLGMRPRDRLGDHHRQRRAACVAPASRCAATSSAPSRRSTARLRRLVVLGQTRRGHCVHGVRRRLARAWRR